VLFSTAHAATQAQELPSAIKQHPCETVAMLEAVFRTALYQQDMLSCTVDAEDALTWLDSACKLAMRLRVEAAWRNEAAAAQQLFGLAASVFKSASMICSSGFADRLHSSSDSGRLGNLLLHTLIYSEAMLEAAARDPQQGHEAALTRQLLLQGRRLGVIGTVCSLGSSEHWADQLAPLAGGYLVLRAALEAVTNCARLLCEVKLPGEAAAAAEATQQLQQQAAELIGMLQQQLQVLEPAGETAELVAAVASQGPDATGVSLQQELQAAFPGDLLQQLQQFGEAVCHQLPVSLWCCNPRCINLQQQSEQELVGGKACVCSACHTARFCSKECLQACWKKQLHRGACKRIAAARQQQQQQQQQLLLGQQS
jgi:hypothetical protein